MAILISFTYGFTAKSNPSALSPPCNHEIGDTQKNARWNKQSGFTTPVNVFVETLCLIFLSSPHLLRSIFLERSLAAYFGLISKKLAVFFKASKKNQLKSIVYIDFNGYLDAFTFKLTLN